jgi:hypothetical protein
MDCCICSPVASVYRLPRNAICAPCHQGAKAIIGFLDRDGEREEDDGGGRSVQLQPRGSAKVTAAHLMICSLRFLVQLFFTYVSESSCPTRLFRSYVTIVG